MEFDNIETIKRAVEIDAGLALLPEPTVQGEVAAKSLVAVPLATNELVRPLGIIHRRGKELGSTTHRFIELLQSEAQAECHCQEHAGTNGEAKNGSAELSPRDYSLAGNGSHHSPADDDLSDDDSETNGHRQSRRERRVGAK
jgi:hypothetical protein